MCNALGKLALVALMGSAFLLLACDSGDGPSSPGEGKYNAFTDKRDGNVYRVVTIGKQTWMAENLRYNPGKSLVNGEYWCADGSTDKCENGYLYSFHAVMNDSSCTRTGCGVVYPHRGICPEGFHVPENYEWRELTERAILFDIPLGISSEFNTEPTGEYEYTFDELHIDDVARYWTSTPKAPNGAYEWYIRAGEEELHNQVFSADYGYALRCVADGEAKLDKYVEFEIPEPLKLSSAASSSSRVTSSSSSKGSSSSSETLVESSSSEDYVFHDDLEAFTDLRDGEVYTQVAIGKQVWMAENLRYVDSSETPELKGATFCWQDDPENCKTRGALYQWHAAMGKSEAECGYNKECSLSDPVRGICPDGFHMPTDDEWSTLLSVVAQNSALGMWAAPRGTDSYGFWAIPTGEMDGRDGKKYSSEENAHYWSATSPNSKSAVTWYLYGNGLSGQPFDKRMGYAVRCVKDAENAPE